MKREIVSRLILGTTVWLKPNGKKYIIATISHGKAVLRVSQKSEKEILVPWGTSVYYREDSDEKPSV